MVSLSKRKDPLWVSILSPVGITGLLYSVVIVACYIVGFLEFTALSPHNAAILFFGLVNFSLVAYFDQKSKLIKAL